MIDRDFSLCGIINKNRTKNYNFIADSINAFVDFIRWYEKMHAWEEAVAVRQESMLRIEIMLAEFIYEFSAILRLRLYMGYLVEASRHLSPPCPTF